MFDNIGSKIKTIAEVCFAISACAAIILGVIALMDVFIGGILVALLIVLISWVSCAFIYAIGEIVERLKSIDEKMSANITLPNPSSNNASVDNIVEEPKL